MKTVFRGGKFIVLIGIDTLVKAGQSLGKVEKLGENSVHPPDKKFCQYLLFCFRFRHSHSPLPHLIQL